MLISSCRVHVDRSSVAVCRCHILRRVSAHCFGWDLFLRAVDVHLGVYPLGLTFSIRSYAV
jgi:hypothetical protein